MTSQATNKTRCIFWEFVRAGWAGAVGDGDAVAVLFQARALTEEQSFFLFLMTALLANPLLWPMGLVACFPLIVLMVDTSETPNWAALVPIVTKQFIGNWNFGVWIAAAAW